MVEGKKSTNFLQGILYLSPAIILMAIFTFYPLVNTFFIAFKENYNYMLGGAGSKLGFGNFTHILKEKEFLYCLVNTMVIVFVSVPLSIVLSLILSVLLNSIKALQRFFQTVFFLPYVTNSIAIGMVFSIMFYGNGSLVNSLIRTLGGESVKWLGGNYPDAILFGANILPADSFFTPQWLTSMIVLMIYIVWNSLPFKILILLSSLQSIDKQYYQAAQIDGTSKFRTFTKITVPLLSPQIFYLLITSFIGAFKEYSSIVAIFDTKAKVPGTIDGTFGTVVWYIKKKTQEGGTTMGYAAAGAVVLFVIIMLFTAINSWVSKKRVHY